MFEFFIKLCQCIVENLKIKKPKFKVAAQNIGDYKSHLYLFFVRVIRHPFATQRVPEAVTPAPPPEIFKMALCWRKQRNDFNSFLSINGWLMSMFSYESLRCCLHWSILNISRGGWDCFCLNFMDYIFLFKEEDEWSIVSIIIINYTM